MTLYYPSVATPTRVLSLLPEGYTKHEKDHSKCKHTLTKYLAPLQWQAFAS